MWGDLMMYASTATSGANVCALNSASNAGICMETYNSNVAAGNLGIIQSVNGSGSTVQPLSIN